MMLSDQIIQLVAATHSSVPGLDAQHAALGVLLTWWGCLQGSDHTVELIAAILLPVAIVMCAYALTVFIWRAKAITRKQVGSLTSNHTTCFLVQWLYCASQHASQCCAAVCLGQLRRTPLDLQYWSSLLLSLCSSWYDVTDFIFASS